MGCASSAMTKLVTSTMFEIGLRPMASRRYWSHKGDGWMVTFSKTRAE